MAQFSPAIGFEETERLARLLDGKRAVLLRLRDLAARQEMLVENGDTAALVEAIAEKVGWIALLSGIECDLAPYRDQPPEWRLWRTTTERERCGRTAADCRLLLEEIVLREKHCEERLADRKREVAESLRRLPALDGNDSGLE